MIAQAITAAYADLDQEIDIEFNKYDVEFGLSTYDHHYDGAGVCYSSYRRPIINFRPKHRLRPIGMPWAVAGRPV